MAPVGLLGPGFSFVQTLGIFVKCSKWWSLMVQRTFAKWRLHGMGGKVLRSVVGEKVPRKMPLPQAWGRAVTFHGKKGVVTAVAARGVSPDFQGVLGASHASS